MAHWYFCESRFELSSEVESLCANKMLFLYALPSCVSVKFLMWTWVYEKGLIQAYCLPTCLVSQDCDIFWALFWRSCIFVFRAPFSVALKLVLSVGLFPALFLSASWASVFVGSFYWPDRKLLLMNMFCWALGFMLAHHSSKSKLFVNIKLFLWWVICYLYLVDTDSNWLYVF